MDIAAWLKGLGLERYEQTFRDNDLDAEVLPELTEADLEKLGVSLGHRKRLLKAIAALWRPPDAGAAGPAQAGLPPGLPEAERRQVTVLFADLAGFTRLAAELEVEQVRALLDRFFGTVDALIVGHGGTVDKHIGDCVMALFGAPVAHTDDPERAVRAALTIRDAMPELRAALGRDLGVHIGVASGEVVAGGSAAQREYTVTGESVNLAARLADRAQAGEILVSEAVFGALGERVVASAADQLALDGFARPIRAWWVSELHSGADPVRPGPFIGRAAELAQLGSLLEACRTGARGQVVRIRGEAGIGKTRLVEEFLREARAKGVAAHKALVLDFGAGKGQDAVRALVASLLGLELGAGAPEREATGARALAEGLVDDEQAVHLNDLLDLPQPAGLAAVYDAMDIAARQQGRRQTVCDLVRRLSRREPRLLVVEDVHWADAATLGHLATLATAVGECAAVLVLTSRIDGDPLGPSWRAAAAGVPMATIDLAPLRRQEALALAAALVDAGSRFVEACVERAGGNPLFLDQLLRSAEEAASGAVPGSIRSVVLARMDMLAPRDRQALQAASVLGQRFEPAELHALLGDDIYACDELVRRCLLRPEGDGYLFVHALVRDGAYASLLQARRRELHARAAAWFAGRDPVLHAQHLDQAGDPRAPAAYLAAAEEQARAYRHERARQLVERGLALAITPDDRFALAFLQGEILRELGAATEALAAYGQALDASGTEADRCCRARVGLAGCLRVLDRYDEAFSLLDEAEAEAGAAGLDLELARVHHLRGNLCFPLGQIDRCQAEHARALDHARRAGSVELEARALGGLGDGDYMRGRMRTAGDRFGRCVELARDQDLGRIEVANLPMVGHCLTYSCEFDRALEVGRQALELASRVGHLRAEIITHNLLGDVGQSRNEPDRSEEAARRLLQLARQIGSKRFEARALHFHASVTRLCGRREDAEALLGEALAMARESGLHFTGPWILAELALTTPDPTRRAEALSECGALLAEGSIGHNYFWSYRYAIEASLDAAAWDEAERYAQALEDYTRPEPLAWSDFWIAWGRALAAHGRGEAGPGLRSTLARVRDQAVRVGMGTALPRLDRALDGL